MTARYEGLNESENSHGCADSFGVGWVWFNSSEPRCTDACTGQGVDADGAQFTYARVEGARAQVSLYRKELADLSEQNLALAQQYYNAMLVGSYALLQAKAEQVQHQVALIEAVADYWNERVTLEQALGCWLETGKTSHFGQDESGD